MASRLPPEALSRIVVHTADPDGARQAFIRRQAVADGVFMARDLVNEPANVLGPVEFAERCRALASVGVEVEVLDVDAMKALGMNCLLGVAQGSDRPARAVVMQWNGAKSKRAKPKPLCFIGKGVCFDTGGISIKPAAGMEDMKGDMAGAATVVGLMHALAARRAAVSVVGIVGLVENMPSSNAQRPGDIVTSMSGQTVEVLNTDAEGRLVLADLMTYAQERFRPKLIVDLATLTGAILVALGKEYAGLFATDDRLAQELSAAGEATGERVWRMPLDRAYDKLLDFQERRHEEHRRPPRRLDHGGPLHRSLRQGHALGPPRRRRSGHGQQQERHQPGLGLRLGHPSPRPLHHRRSREGINRATKSHKVQLISIICLMRITQERGAGQAGVHFRRRCRPLAAQSDDAPRGLFHDQLLIDMPGRFLSLPFRGGLMKQSNRSKGSDPAHSVSTISPPHSCADRERRP